MKKIRIGLALGGGAARAITHIGVLEALEGYGIPIDVVAGTSMGAIIGALYAIAPDTRAIRERMLQYTRSEEFRESRFDFMKDRADMEGGGIFYHFSQMARRGLFYSLSMARRSFVLEETAKKNFAFLIPDIAIEEMGIPFCATATDLQTGREFHFIEGSLRQAIAASCALPGILPPVELDGHLLVDGGWIDAVPVMPAFNLGADFVIGVDIEHEFEHFEAAARGLDIVFRADMVTRNALARERLNKADIVLRPNVGKDHWADFSRIDERIQVGRAAVADRITDIRQAIRAKGRKRWWAAIR